MRPLNLLRSIAFAAALSLPVIALADASAESFVKTKQQEITILLKQKGDATRIEAVFDGLFDYEALARGSLESHWDGRSEVERKEFRDVLKQLVQRAYRKNLTKTANYDVRFEGQTQGKDGQIVRTIAKSRKDAREEPVEIDYVVHRVDGVWRVHDIVTEGSSLVTNYRRQFTRIIKKDGFEELMRKMKKKLAEES